MKNLVGRVVISSLAMLIAGLLCAPAWADEIACRRASEAIKAKDNRTAQKIYEPLAKDGVACAIGGLGRMGVYSSIDNKSLSRSRGFGMVEKAASMGDGKSQEFLGLVYYNGSYGRPQNYEVAKGYLKAAAAQGFGDAAHTLGYMFDHGIGVEEDPGQAFYYYKIGAEAEHPGSQHNLGLFYKNGRGTRQDFRMAAIYLEKSAVRGNARAQTNLGYLYQNGTGVTKDLWEAKYWHEKSAAQGNVYAISNLGVIAYEQENYEAALKYWEEAADQDHPDGLHNLGLLYEEGRAVKQDLEEAIAYYKKAADEGHAKALFRLGNFHAEGRGLDKDLVRAHAMHSLAAIRGWRDSSAIRDKLAGQLTDGQKADSAALVAKWNAKGTRLSCWICW